MSVYEDLKKSNNKEVLEVLNKFCDIYSGLDIEELTEELYEEFVIAKFDEDSEYNNKNYENFTKFLKESLEIEEKLKQELINIKEDHKKSDLLEFVVYPKGLKKYFQRRIVIPSFYTFSEMCYSIFASFELFSEELYILSIDDTSYETILNENIDESSFIAEEEYVHFYPFFEDSEIKILFNDYEFICKFISICHNDEGYDNAYLLDGKGYRLVPDKEENMKKYLKGNYDKSSDDYYEIKEAIETEFDISEANELLPSKIEEYRYSFEEEPYDDYDGDGE